MCRVPLLGTVLIATFLVQLASAGPRPAKTKSQLKDWSGPDVSLKLQNQGKQTATGKALVECESAARSLFAQKKYDDALTEYQKCAELDPNDFDAYLGLGYTFYNLRRYQEGANALEKAQELRPENFEAYFWKGMCLAKDRKLKEAIPDFEKAHQIKPDDKAARFELFGCYLATQQVRKAFEIFPIIVRAVGLGLIGVYFSGFTVLLVFSLPRRSAAFPGFWFAITWLALFIEGQVALFFLLPVLLGVSGSETALLATTLAGLPIMIVAATGFVRQPWGEPFRWPPRFGKPKIVMISVSLLFLTILIGAVFAQIYVQLTHKPFPLQHVIPLIKETLQSNPALAWVTVAMAIPVIEEILFRGLLFGAFQKWWGMTGAIPASAFLFACIHLQLFGFLQLFCLGLILGWARSRSGSLGLPVFIHALNNSLVMVALTFISL
jgi:membrane protease YdiL (CAAX protease family)/Flp pilus assembly protein TadD